MKLDARESSKGSSTWGDVGFERLLQYCTTSILQWISNCVSRQRGFFFYLFIYLFIYWGLQFSLLEHTLVFLCGLTTFFFSFTLNCFTFNFNYLNMFAMEIG